MLSATLIHYAASHYEKSVKLSLRLINRKEQVTGHIIHQRMAHRRQGTSEH